MSKWMPSGLGAEPKKVLFLIAVFPANAYAAEHPDRFGAIAIPFWRRYFAQLALILVVVLAAL